MASVMQFPSHPRSDYFRNIAATDFVEKDQKAVDIKVDQ